MPELHFSDIHHYVDLFAAGDTSVNSAAQEFSRADLCAFLRQNVDEITRMVRAMTPAQLAYRLPGPPEGWDSSGDEEHFDATQIVTHLASGIAFHWWGISRALGHPRPDFPRPPQGISTTGKNRNMLGGGGWTGIPIEEAVSLLHATTERFLNYVNSLPDEQAGAATASLGIFKDLTPHGWLFLDAIHTAMHIQQLAEMQSQPDYPAA
ncbi:MAG: DinB family protein [Chloroflexota bacterium]|nr:DinB family protein [Chloroflexota bacterium]